MKSELVCVNNNNTSVITTTTTTNTLKNEQDNNNTINNNNNSSNSEMDCEYSICAMFSIYYPMIQNFNNFNIKDSIEQQINGDSNNNNKDSIDSNNYIIPKIITPISWNEITESDSSLYSSSPSSSVYSFSEEDFDNTSSQDNNNKKNNNNNNSNKKQVNKTNNNNNGNNNKSIKKVFVGGISFSDIQDDENLKKLRIEKIVHLFTSFGLVSKTNFHWNKGFFFIIYSSSKVANNVVQSFSTFKNRQKYVNNIKESLSKEFKDIKATPTPNFYVRFPSNK